jgi:phosphoserine phosphatase
MQGTPHIAITPEPLVRALRGAPSVQAALVSRLSGPPGLAAFDADGTLWAGDLGEAVLIDLISRRRLLDAPRDPWATYLGLFDQGPAAAFAYAGRLMAGLSETEVRETSARVFAADFTGRIFPETRWLLETLAGRGWQVYIVSASNRWSIEVAAAATFGLTGDRVVALDVEVEGGVLTDRVCLPVPTLEGKPRLLAARSGRSPDLAFGNSILDLPLLLAAELPVAVGPAPGPRNPPEGFLAEAAGRGWARLEIPVA